MAFDDYIGRTEERTDTVSALAIRGLAATLDVTPPPDGSLPPLWHWMLFQDWAPASALGPDGHPKRGGFLPPVHDLPRRMWAGGRLAFPGALHVNDAVRRVSTILAVEEKHGGSGRLVFVTLRHDLFGPDGLAITEEQDIVYRGTEGAAVKAAPPVPPAPQGAWRQQVQGDPVRLFRYSALTGNGHRIHYDLDYVTQQEGYPGLVVHGPLQATWLAGLLAANRPAGQPGNTLDSFAFRGRRPAFHTTPLALEGWQGTDGICLRSVDSSGAVCMAAEAQLR